LLLAGAANVYADVYGSISGIVRKRVSLEARVLNVFDQQTVLQVDTVPYLDPRHRLKQDPWIVQDMNQPNPNYAKATRYAFPRRYIASVRVDF
jgi:outer membrane receptor protein involved in Fe transport